MIVQTNSVEETLALGRILGGILEEKIMISLSGDLAAGKTHLSKGIAKGMGIQEEITSPTFALVQEYEAADNPGQKLDLCHFDLYRIMDPEELYFIGYDDYLKREAVLLIEWPENAPSELLDDRLAIRLDLGEVEDQRRIEIQALGPNSEKVLEKLSSAITGEKIE